MPQIPGLSPDVHGLTADVKANETKTTFGPFATPGDGGIKAGAGYHIVLAWPNSE